MLKRSNQKAYFTKRWKSIYAHLCAFQEYADTEELHRVRVEIKKLKALLLLDEKQFEKKKFQSHFKLIDKLFDQAGKVRTAQMNLELMNQYGITSGKTDKEQTAILIRESAKLFSKLDHYLKYFAKKPGFFLHRFSSFSDKKIKKEFGEQLKSLAKTFEKQPKGKTLHNCRKEIKQLIYRTDILPEQLNRELNLNKQYLKKLEEKIGEWHDTLIAIELSGAKDVIKKIEETSKQQLEEIHLRAKHFKKKARLGNFGFE
jgi:CHAD domain-containing protein